MEIIPAEILSGVAIFTIGSHLFQRICRVENIYQTSTYIKTLYIFFRYILNSQRLFHHLHHNLSNNLYHQIITVECTLTWKQMGLVCKCTKFRNVVISIPNYFISIFIFANTCIHSSSFFRTIFRNYTVGCNL